MELTKRRRVELIGLKCVVTAVYFGKPDWKRQNIEARPAWVTGFGTIRRGFTDYLGHDEGVVFCQTGAIKVVKVRFWPTEKEVSVPLDAFILDPTVEPFSNMSKYSKRDREFYAENTEQYPRGKNGRFVSDLVKP